MKPTYYYKHSKVNGKLYMQIWKRIGKKKTYVMSLGPAELLYTRLVRPAAQQEQTKETGLKGTKNPRENAQELTNKALFN